MKKMNVLYVLVVFCFAFIVIVTYKLQLSNGLFGHPRFSATQQTSFYSQKEIDIKSSSHTDIKSSSPTDKQEKTNTSEEWTSTIVLTSGVECPAIVKDESGKKKSSGCRIPELDPFHPSMMKYIEKTNDPNCFGTTYGTLWNGTLKFTDSNVVSASYRPILRDGDFKFKLGNPIVEVGTDKIADEMIEVNFKLKNGKVVKDYFLQVIPHKHLVESEGTKKPGIPLNILTLGIDSLSYGNTRRKLPKVYEFLKNDLGAYFFNGHAIVGDGTTPQLTAMLTGLHVEEQYEARTGKLGAKPLDGWNWVFKELKQHGYLTGFSEDGIWEGPFQYRLLGFTDAPTDFFPRPFFLNIARRSKNPDHCINNRNVPYIHLDYVRTVFDSFPNKLKFFVSFNAAYSHHEINRVQKNEKGVMDLLVHFKAKGYLNNTLLIVMGDHGLRFGAVRTQVQGKLEERLPLFAMAFPPWFATRYPELVKVLETNTDRLTSWFDVHATFRHILSYPDRPMNEKRGISLFEEIPASRTCADAGISDHWCPCLQWETVKVEHSHIQNAALAAIEYMNDLLKKNTASASHCAHLTLKAVNFAQLERPNEAVVKQHLGANAVFKQSQEYFCRYQLQFVTLPNEGVFEATVKFHKKRFIVSTSISRINKYGDQPKCVAVKIPHVRKYCLCKDYNGPL